MKDDKLERDLIVKDINHNYFVKASAGSGKTTSLVYRMVSMVESGIPVEKICTITFTKAAADEFFSRFQAMLSARSVWADTTKKLTEEDDVKRKKCENALKNIDLCFMGTIDAFCNMIAHELPNELHVPSDAQIVDDDELNKAVKEEFETLLRDDKNHLHPYALAFKEIFYPSYDCFVAGFKKLNELRTTEYEYDKSLVDIDFEEYFSPEKSQFIDLCKMLKEANVKVDTNDGRKAIEALNNSLFRIKGKWSSRNLKAVDDLLKALSKIGTFPGEQIKDSILADTVVAVEYTADNKVKSKLKYTEEIVDLFSCLDEKIKDYKYALFMHVVSEALIDVSNKLKQEGKFTFFDFLLATNKAFKESSATDRELLDHILERHSYFLLDESQDTNPLQTEIFFYLTGTKITDDWSKTEPREGSLFIVGDPKQSIYAFRGANVKAYEKTESLFKKKDEVLVLRRNFRSIVSLRDWFNKAMNNVFDPSNNSLIHEEIPIDEREFELEYPKVDKDITVLDGVYKYILSDPKNDYESVAKMIKDLVNNPNRRIVYKSSKGPNYQIDTREISYKDFLVVPFTTRIEEYAKAFDKYQIPYTIEAKIPFEVASSLLVLVDLVKLFKAPQVRANLIKVLTSDLYKLSDTQISILVSNNFDFDITNIEHLYIDEKYKGIIEELNRLYVTTKDMSYSSMCLYLLNDKQFNLLNKVDSSFLEYTYFFIEKIKSKEETGNMSGIVDFIETAVAFIDGKSSDKDSRVLRFKDKVDKVKISNLHKVKGLQAPIVILVQPRKSVRTAIDYVDYESNPPKSYFKKFTIKNSNGSDSTVVENTSINEDKIKKWNLALDYELDRLQYVGATRAESVLLVSETANIKGNFVASWSKLTKEIKDENIYPIPEVSEPSEVIKVPVTYKDNKKIDNPSFSVAYHAPNDVSKDRRIISTMDNNDILLDNSDATLLGSLVHKVMEILVTTKGHVESKEALVDSVIKELGGEEYKDPLLGVVFILSLGGYEQKNSSVHRDILYTLYNAKNVQCEVPFSYKKGNTIITGVIDVLYQDDNGDYHIIDYKTNKEDDVSKLEEMYASQLQDYVDALKQAHVSVKDAHIYHIKIK